MDFSLGARPSGVMALTALGRRRQEISWLHSGFARHTLNLLLAENIVQLLRRDRLVCAVANPGLSDPAKASLLKLRDEPAEPAAGPIGLTATQHPGPPP